MTKKLTLTAIVGIVVLAGCLNVVEPIQREYHIDTAIQPGEIYTKKLQVNNPSERVAPTICYNVSTNHSASMIYVFNNTRDLDSYRQTLRREDNLSDLDRRLSQNWQFYWLDHVYKHVEDSIEGGVDPGTYYFTVENTPFQRTLKEESIKGPLKMQLNLYVANKECPFTYPGPP